MKQIHVSCVILASGFSRRMGEQKLLLPYMGKTIIETVIDKALRSKLKDIYVVIPEQDQARKDIVCKYPVHIVNQPYPENGMGNSLAAGIKALAKRTDAAIILLGDQPSLMTDDINKLYEHFIHCSRQCYGSPKMIIQTKYQNGQRKHPILFSQYFFPLLTNLDGDTGGRNIIRQHADSVHFIQSRLRDLNDIDTREDYIKLLEQ